MTNVAEKTDLKKLIEDFIITEVIEDDFQQLIVMGENEYLAARVNKIDVISLHPGATGYTESRDSDRDNSHHISPEDLWENGSDKGHPVDMVAEVWHMINKRWLDENHDEVLIEKRFDKGRVAVYEQDAKAKHSWENQSSNDKEVQKLIEHGFWIWNIVGDSIWTHCYGFTETIEDESFPKLLKMFPRGLNGVDAIFKRSA